MYFENYSMNGWPNIRGLAVVTKTKENNIECFSYRYNVGYDFPAPEKLMEAVKFAEENFKDDWLIGCERSGFENEEDAMVFKLAFV